MNKEQIIDVVYENYVKETMFNSNPKWLEPVPVMNMKTGEKSMGARQFFKESFINKCKTDSEFSEKWGLKIEERDLTREERIDLYAKEYTPGMRNKYEPPFDDFIDAKLSVRNIPTKLITITYNNETIESYE